LTHPLESYHTPTSASSTSQPSISSTSRRTIRQESVVPQPRSPTQTHVADEATSTGVDVRYGGVATTVTGLEQDRAVFDTSRIDGFMYNIVKESGELGDKLEADQANIQIVVSDDEEDLEDPSKQGSKISEIDQDPTILLVQHDVEIQGRLEHDMELEFDLDAAKDVSTAEEDISTAKPVSTAGAAVTIASVDVSTATISTAKDKALRLQAELEEWDDIQARVEVDKELAQRLQVEKREKYSEAEKARLLAELINHRKRYFAAQKAEEKRNRPPTQAQQRTYMSNYIKHMGAYTLQQLRSYSFDELNNLFEITLRRVHTFVPMDSEIERAIPESTAGSSKRDAEEELAQESSKRQKTRESSVSAEEPKYKEEELSQERLQQMMIIVPEQGMNVEPLQTKYPIIDWKIYTKGPRKYWKIIRVGNHTKVYQFFDDMLKAFDREDLVKLWSLVKEKFNSTEPTEDKEREIWVELKRLFKPDTDDELWKL
ncbi:hypothetical protein Tco_0848870, partial [Tanacetum coccineum]